MIQEGTHLKRSEVSNPSPPDQPPPHVNRAHMPIGVFLALGVFIALGAGLRAAPIHDAAGAGNVAQVRSILATDPGSGRHP